MRIIFSLLLLCVALCVSALSYASLTAGVVPVTKTGGSTPLLQNGSITDTGTASGAGNVGIGSSNPGTTLDVLGTVRATALMGAGTTAGAIQLNEPSGTGANFVSFQAPAIIASSLTWTLPNVDGSNGQAMITNGSGTLSWGTASQWLNGASSSINYTNNVGIGTSTTPKLLTVGSTGQTTIDSSGNYATSGGYTQTGSTADIFSGNVGIGTTVAGNALIINGSGQTLIQNGLLLAPGAVVTNSGSTLTLTGANMAKNAIFQETGTTAATFTLDTGTALSSAITGIGTITAGYEVCFMVSNASNQTITMSGATGTTMSYSATVPTLSHQIFCALNTGSNAWTIY